MAKTALSLETPPDLKRPALVANDHSIGWVTQNVCDIVESKTPKWWFLAMCFTTPSL